MAKRMGRVDEQVLAFPGLWISVTLFLVGAVIGSFFSANFTELTQKYVYTYANTIQTATTGQIFWQSFLLDALLLALIFFSAFFRFGVFIIPLTLAVKGFLLSMLVTAFVKTFGLKGYFSAFSTTFVSGFIIIACLLLLALQAFSFARSRPGRGKMGRRVFRREIDRTYLLSGIVCLVIILIFSLINAYLSPVLAGVVFPHIT